MRVSLSFCLSFLGRPLFYQEFFLPLLAAYAIGPVMLRRAGGSDAADQPSLPAAAACALPHKADCRGPDLMHHHGTVTSVSM